MKLLLTGAYAYSKDQIAIIKELGYDLFFHDDVQQLMDYSLAKSIELVICNAFFKFNRLERFESLKFIQVTSAGLDRLPLEEIQKRQVTLANARDVYSIPISEWVILKVLEIYKNTRFFEFNQHKHLWVENEDILELYGKTLGIMGYGSIGKEVAKRAQSFGVKIICLDKIHSSDPLVEQWYKIDQLDSFLAKSDIVVLALPLTNETKNLFDKRRINLMKRGSVLINVSRGGIIDETALLKHLKEGNLRGAALDVFESEPLEYNSPLWDEERLLITPHNSFVSERVKARMFDLIIKNLQLFKKGLKPVNSIF